MNNRSFEDRKRTLEKIKSLFFNILYLWTTVYVFPLVISYHDFFIFFCPYWRFMLLIISLLLIKKNVLIILEKKYVFSIGMSLDDVPYQHYNEEK